MCRSVTAANEDVFMRVRDATFSTMKKYSPGLEQTTMSFIFVIEYLLLSTGKVKTGPCVVLEWEVGDILESDNPFLSFFLCGFCTWIFTFSYCTTSGFSAVT